jgi:hypothetical protein
MATETPNPDCEWCRGTGIRASRPAAWYDDKPDYVTTIFPCSCTEDE